jgi:HK97 family phage major capsid protein
MADKLTDIKQERARAVGELRAIIDAAEADNDGKGRALTAEERQSLDSANAEIDQFNERIANLENVRRVSAEEARHANQIDPGALGHDKDDRKNAETGRKYDRAFNRYLHHGMAALEQEDRSILNKGYQTEQRDGMVTGTTTLGGFTVPQDFSSKLFSLKIQAGAVRQTQVTNFVTGDGRAMPVPVATAHAAASWGSEATAPGVTNETFAQFTLNAYPSVALEKLSFELVEDSAFDLASFLANIIGQKIGRLQNLGYINGSGSSQPTGMINFAGVSSTVTASHTTFTGDEAIAWYYALQPQYRSTAEFLLHDTAENVLRGLKATTGQYLWQPGLTADAPNTLLGRPIYNDPDLQAVGSINQVVGVFADFANFYVIRDVHELIVRRLEERYADTRQVGFIAWQRTDGHVADTVAGAQLKMSAT